MKSAFKVQFDAMYFYFLYFLQIEKTIKCYSSQADREFTFKSHCKVLEKLYE